MSEEKIVTKEVNVVRLKEGKFLTLTKQPANQVAFKVVRDDAGAKKRTLRRAVNPSLAVIFPADMGEDECKKVMAEYGFDNYTLVAEETTAGEKRWKAYRSDIKPEDVPEDALRIAVGNGIKVVVSRKHTRSVQGKADNLAVVAFEFDAEKFPSTEAISDWLQRKDVDFAENRIENSDTSVLYRRAEVPENAEVGKVEVEAGVLAHVVRQETMDMPASMIEIVSEAAFGNWGWGQLDFAAILADREYSEAVREATDVLYRTLDEVLYWSALPLAVRKELVARATTQYTSYVIELMDALPPKTVMINRSMKEQEMTTKKDEKQKAEDIARSEAEAKAKAEQEAADKAKAEAEAAAAKPITRAEAEALIKDTVTAAVTAAFEAQAKRNDPPTGTEGEGKEGKGEAPANDGEATKEILRSLTAVADGLKSVTDTVKGMQDAQGKIVERIEKVEGTTHVRSDDKDGKQGSGKPDVFAGIFGGGKKAS